MMKPKKTPAGQAPAGSTAAAGRRHRAIAISLGVSALLALGGVVWASGLAEVPRTGGAQGAAPANAAATVPAPAATTEPAPAAPGTEPDPAAPGTEVSTAPDPALPGAPAPAAESSAAPAVPAPAAANPAAADPAPVDRKGKSEEELATIAQPVAPAVDLKSKKTVKGGVSATITEMAAVQGIAEGIGEVAGPALRFKVTVLNDTAEALALDGAVVDVSYGDDEQPASQLSGPDPAAFPASVAPGESGVGVFIFAVPLEARDKVRIHFNLEAETPIATFAGTAPA